MKIGLIKNGQCENIIVADSLKVVANLFGDQYAAYECPVNYGIGDLCYEGTWIAGGPSLVKVCPQCGNYVPITAIACPVCNYAFDA